MMGDAFYGEGVPEQCELFLTALESFCVAHTGKFVIGEHFLLLHLTLVELRGHAASAISQGRRSQAQ